MRNAHGKMWVIFLREVRGWNSPFLRLTDDRKRCFKQKRLNFEVEMQYKAGTKCDNSISGPERKDGALGGYKVKTALKH